MTISVIEVRIPGPMGPAADVGISDVTGLTDALAAKLDIADAAFFATAAQGALANSAVQPGDLAPVATSGAYGDLSGRPTLGTAAALDVGAGVQAYSAKLAALAALAWASDTVPYFTGAGTADKFAFSSYMRGLMSTASASALKSALAITAADIPFTPTGAVAATNVQEAIADLSGWIGILAFADPAPPQDQQIGLFTEAAYPSKRAAIALWGEDLGDHLGEIHGLVALQNRPVGSGTNGPGNSDCALLVSNIKQDTVTTAVEGELDGVYVVVRNGGTHSDCSAILADVGHYGTGFVNVLEGGVTIIDPVTDTVTNRVGVQIGVLNNYGTFNALGYFAYAEKGASVAAFWSNNGIDGSWEYMFRGQVLGVDRFLVTDNGSIIVKNGAGITSHADSSSTTGPRFTAEQAGTGDATIEWLLSLTQSWTAGIDNSDANSWKLCPANDGFASAVLRADVNGAITALKPTGGIGYGTGAGGTVTQATSKSTGVTLNKVAGQITMSNAALSAGAEVTFVVTNSAVAAADVIIVNHVSGGTAGAYVVGIAAVSAGGFTIVVSNVSAGDLSEAIVLGFAIIKGAVA